MAESQIMDGKEIQKKPITISVIGFFMRGVLGGFGCYGVNVWVTVPSAVKVYVQPATWVQPLLSSPVM